MSENKDVGEEELIRNVSTVTLIKELSIRKLSKEEITEIQQLGAISIDEDPQGEQVKLGEMQAERKEDEVLVDTFIKAVLRKNILAKLSKGTRIGDQVIETMEGGYAPFKNYGSLISPKDDLGIGRLQEHVLRYKEELPDIFNAQIVVMYPPKLGPDEYDQQNLILGIYFMQDTHEIDNRQTYTSAKAEAVFSKETGLKFYNEIKGNPDLLEKFYQKLFPNLDSREGGPGLKRIKSRGFYFLAPDRDSNRRIDRDQFNPTGLKETFFDESKNYFQYRNGPYGVVPPFEPVQSKKS